MNIRLATEKDIDQLIKMRWDFTNEFNETKVGEEEYDLFYQECNSFLIEALRNDRWFIWVAEKDDTILSHVYIEIINKVPRPGRKTNPFTYMTNVYTVPEHRGQQIGSKLLKQIEIWSRKNEYEFIIVWPSEWSTEFYARNGYKLCNEPMEFMF